MKKLLAAAVLLLSFSVAMASDPAGNDGNVQFNDGGVHGGEDALDYDDVTNTLTVDILDQPAAASPIILLKDSTLGGEVQISMTDAAGVDGIMAMEVDIAGTLVTFFTVDGSLESVDFVYPIRVYDGDSHHIEFDVADLSSDVTATFPASTGTVALTTSNVATATALAANGANCNAGEVPAGVDASGAAESCDATPAIDCTDCTNIPAGSSHTGTVTWGGTAILESGVAFQFGDATDATVTHTYANTGTNVDIAYSTGAMAITGAVTATSYGGITEANLVDKTATESVTGDWTFTPNGTGAHGDIDITIGGADYATAQFGNTTLGASSFSASGLDLDKAFLFRSTGALGAGNDPGIEFAWMEGANTIRMAIPESAAGNATAFIRSGTFAGPYSAATGNDTVLCDTWTAYNSNIDCDTSGTGADLFVQDDLEVEGEIYSSGTIHLDADDANQLTISATSQTAAHGFDFPDDEIASGDVLFGDGAGSFVFDATPAIVGTDFTGTAAGLTAGAATALAANGGNCAAGEAIIAGGVDASGAAEGCDATPAFDGADFTGIVTGGITDGTILEADLNESSGSPVDNDLLTYNAAGGNVTWISTIRKSLYWPASSMSADGTQCADPTETTTNSGPKQYTVVCTDNDAATIYGQPILLPPGWTPSTTFEFELVVHSENATPADEYHIDFSAACRSAGEAINSTYGTEQAADIDFDAAGSCGGSACDQYDPAMVTTSALTPNGTCAAGDFFYWRGQIDATGTTATVADVYIDGVRVEGTFDVAGD